MEVAVKQAPLSSGGWPRYKSGRSQRKKFATGKLHSVPRGKSRLAAPEKYDRLTGCAKGNDVAYWHETDMPKYLGDVRY